MFTYCQCDISPRYILVDAFKDKIFITEDLDSARYHVHNYSDCSSQLISQYWTDASFMFVTIATDSGVYLLDYTGSHPGQYLLEDIGSFDMNYITNENGQLEYVVLMSKSIASLYSYRIPDTTCIVVLDSSFRPVCKRNVLNIRGQWLHLSSTYRKIVFDTYDGNRWALSIDSCNSEPIICPAHGYLIKVRGSIVEVSPGVMFNTTGVSVDVINYRDTVPSITDFYDSTSCYIVHKNKVCNTDSCYTIPWNVICNMGCDFSMTHSEYVEPISTQSFYYFRQGSLAPSIHKINYHKKYFPIRDINTGRGIFYSVTMRKKQRVYYVTWPDL